MYFESKILFASSTTDPCLKFRHFDTLEKRNGQYISKIIFIEWLVISMFVCRTLKLSMILRAEPVSPSCFKKCKAKETSINNFLEF